MGIVIGLGGALALLAVGWPGRAAAQLPVAHVELRPEVEASRLQLTLGDLGRVRAPTVEQRRTLERVPVCFAPVAGGTREITRDYLLLKLTQQHVDTSRVTFGGAQTVRIASVSSRIPAETIEATIRSALAEAMPWPPEDVTIAAPRTLQDLVVAGRNPTLDVVFPDPTDFLGSTRARVDIYAGDDLVDRASYRFSVALYRDILVAATTIPRGTIVEPDQLRIERRDVAPLGGEYIQDPAVVVGQRARRTIQAGTRLGPTFVEDPPVISRGDRVHVQVRGTQFEISITGTAQEAGTLGSIVRVELPTRRRVYVRVTGPGEGVIEE